MEPFADFDRVDAVLVLVRKDGAARERRAGVADRADRLRRRDPAGLGVLVDHDRRRRRRTCCSSRSSRSRCSAASIAGAVVGVRRRADRRRRRRSGRSALTSLLLTLAGLLGRPLRRDDRGAAAPHAPLVATCRRDAARRRSAATCSHSLLGEPVAVRALLLAAAGRARLQRAARLPGVRRSSAGSSAPTSACERAREVELVV